VCTFLEISVATIRGFLAIISSEKGRTCTYCIAKYFALSI